MQVEVLKTDAGDLPELCEVMWSAQRALNTVALAQILFKLGPLRVEIC